MTAALPMGGNKVTGAADPTVSTDLATKNYVDTTTAAFFSTGDLKPTIKIVPDTGWLMLDDGTFGSASSGSSNSNSVNNLALFTLIFNNISDTYAPIFTSGGGATTRAGQTNAATAWAANCRMSLPKALGRELGISGAGAGLTARALGQTLGEETHLLVANEIPAINSSALNAITVVASGAIPVTGNLGDSIQDNPGTPTTGGVQTPYNASGHGWSGVTSLSGNNTINVASSNTGGVAHNNMQPTLFVNAMIKI